jgi:hypothetical protein
MKRTLIICDICHTDSMEVLHHNTLVSVIWTVEDNEGHSTKPYLQNNTLDICGNCMAHILDGNFVYCESRDVYSFRTPNPLPS